MPHTNQFSSSADCSWVSYTSDTNKPYLVQTPQVKDSAAQDWPRFSCRSQVPSCHLCFWLAINWDSHDPLLSGAIICWNGSQNSGKCSFQSIIRDADEQSDEEVHKAKSRRSQAQGLLSPWKWGTPPSRLWTCSLTWKLSAPHSLGIFTETSSRRHDQLLTQSSAPLFSFPWRVKDRAESSKNLNIAWSLVTCSNPKVIQDPTKHCLKRTEETPISQEWPRDLGALSQELGSETRC